MNRRQFFRSLLGLAALPAATAAQARPRRLVLQESPLAGFQFHRGEALWYRLAVGSPLALVREPRNPHDPRAVAVTFEGEKIGYVPRLDNAAVAQLLDRGEPLEARVTRLRRSRDPWERVGFEVAVLRGPLAG
ncbi:MAG: HIRAN domain-containing protein [Deferrisomatales bacterium]